MSHDWQPMPGYPGELACARCNVVKALCGTEHCDWGAWLSPNLTAGGYS